MIIKDFINGNIIDTNKLPDVDSLLMEKVEELTILCQKYGYRSALMVEQKMIILIGQDILIEEVMIYLI
jgi:hypothetical protein